MKLQTNIPITTETRNPIQYDSKLLMIGSCFSENIGDKLNYFKFQTVQNPLGILFHPVAIENLITNAINEKVYTEKEVFFLNERWHSFDSHSNLSSSKQETLLASLNNAIKTTNKQLHEATHLIITLGTSWVYRHIESDCIVANCHKVKQKKFLKELLTVDEITESLEAIIALVRSVNPTVQVVFTISPVRHLKDGFVENQRSKSHLIIAIQNLLSTQVTSRGLHYFPAYEIMMDELRDYRFYNEDMVHPNNLAIQYIWEQFVATWISDKSYKTMKEIEAIQLGLSHKPFNKNSEQHQQFLSDLGIKIKKIQARFPHISF